MPGITITHTYESCGWGDATHYSTSDGIFPVAFYALLHPNFCVLPLRLVEK